MSTDQTTGSDAQNVAEEVPTIESLIEENNKLRGFLTQLVTDNNELVAVLRLAEKELHTGSKHYTDLYAQPSRRKVWAVRVGIPDDEPTDLVIAVIDKNDLVWLKVPFFDDTNYWINLQKGIPTILPWNMLLIVHGALFELIPSLDIENGQRTFHVAPPVV